MNVKLHIAKHAPRQAFINFLILLLVSAILALPTLVHAQVIEPTREADIAAIKAARVASNRAIAAHDAVAVASFWDEEYVIAGSSGEVAAGRGGRQDRRHRQSPADDQLRRAGARFQPPRLRAEAPPTRGGSGCGPGHLPITAIPDSYRCGDEVFKVAFEDKAVT
ncbi:MAG: hypothetical protein SH820_11040 [Xanthomonadales bacterium]|nr:hypothetical protein [Xanthomonadales bacterium]